MIDPRGAYRILFSPGENTGPSGAPGGENLRADRVIGGPGAAGGPSEHSRRELGQNGHYSFLSILCGLSRIANSAKATVAAVGCTIHRM